jgi:predicted transcriptional regulator
VKWLTERELVSALATPLARLLSELCAGETTITELRKKHGSKIYSQVYKLAYLGIIEVKDRNIFLTELGEKICACLEHYTNCIKKALEEIA